MNQKMNDILDAIPDALLIVSRRGCILWCNRKVEALLGYRNEDIVGKPIETLIPQNTRKDHIKMRNRFNTTPTHRAMGYSSNLHAQDANGNQIPVEVELSPIQWGDVPSVLSVLRSRVNRQAQERAQQKTLRVNEERLRRSQEVAHIGTWDFDSANNTFTCSKELCNIFGIENAAIDATPGEFLKLIHPDDRCLVDRALDDFVINKTPFKVEFRISHSTGKPTYVKGIGEVYFRSSGNSVNFVGTIQDISIEVDKRLRLQISQTIFENAHEVIMTVDKKYNVITANPSAINIFGFFDREIIGRPVLQFILESDIRNRARSILRKIRNNGRWQGEVEFRTRNLIHHSALLSITPIERLSYRLDQYVITLTDISAIKRNEAKLKNLAHYDQLTGLPNRTLFISSLKSAIKDEYPFTVHYIDLDGFKNVNDSQGHDAGDRILQEISSRLLQCTGDKMVAARIGGDEFAVLQTNTDVDKTDELATSIIENLQLHKEYADLTLDISASVGISRFPEEGVDPMELIKKADQAMYQAKSNGKNTFTYYNASLGDDLSKKLQLVSELKKTIIDGSFVLYYQPKTIKSRPNTDSVEALIRWFHPTLGEIPPLEFIPLAEENGIILEIGEHVLMQVCRFMHNWKNRYRKEIKVAINLSARQLHDINLLSKIEKAIAEFNIDPSQLEFEITESVAMEDVHYSLSIFQKLKSMGSTIAIDDFGTGYSSLSHLKKLPVDILKIDRSFIQSLSISSDDFAIVRAIITMAHSLGIQTVAEGVETIEQKNILIELGCDQFQGYYIGKPVPADQLNFG